MGGSAIWLLTIAPFTAAMIGGIHCIGMCGAIATWACQRHALAYHMGRLLGYLGLVSIGSWALQRVPPRFQIGLGLLLGIAIIATGVRGLLGNRIAPPQWITQSLTARLGRLVSAIRHPILQGLCIGIITAILPCGWLYSMVSGAVATGSIPTAAIMITSFWLGTIPPLWLNTTLWQRVAIQLGRRAVILQSIILIGLGLITVGVKISKISGGTNPIKDLTCHVDSTSYLMH